MDTHTKLVKSLIEAFKGRGYIILRAVAEGYNPPYTIGRHKPDIIAKDTRGVLIIGEAKIGEDLLKQETKEKFTDFSSRIMSEGILRGTNIPLHIIVPKDKMDLLRQVLGSLGLSNKIGERIILWAE